MTSKRAPLLSVIILTRNEERHLARALASLGSISTEVFVVDSFSSDGTEEIARQHGAHFVQHPFLSHSAQLRWALGTLPIRGAWTMKLDADEYLEPDLQAAIDVRLSTLHPETTGIYVRCKQVFLGKWIRFGGVYPLSILRIWRTGSGTVQDKLMDEHVVLTRGSAIEWKEHLANHPLIGVREFCDKHLGYAEREASDYLARERLRQSGMRRPTGWPRTQQQFRAVLKEGFYERLPFLVGPFAYWLYRMVVRSGWRDGVRGATYHFLQALWYRAMVQIYARTWHEPACT